MQLVFSFLDAADPPPAGPSRTTVYWRRRIDRATRAAFELGRRQKGSRAQPSRSLGAASVRADNVAPARPFFASRADRNELDLLARRVARLSISRRDPEAFFVERDSIFHALRAIAKRA
jgi:hypothetical protein